MPRSDRPADLEPSAVQALARCQGFAPLAPELAARIAAGAGNAVRAVAAHARQSLFDAEPLEFLAELERLAGED